MSGKAVSNFASSLPHSLSPPRYDEKPEGAPRF
jgi:hypothetical protein